LRIGSLKANAGHTEPGAGLAGASKLLMQLRDASVSPNAQLRALNVHVGDALRHCVACGLPTQATRTALHRMHVGGVSSFGYAGTIAHAALVCPGGIETSHIGLAAHRLVYHRRRAFPWVLHAASYYLHDAAKKSLYTSCWPASHLSHSSVGMTCLLLARNELASTSAVPNQYRRLKPCLLLPGGVSCTPLMQGERLLVSFVQLVAASAQTPHIMVLTCGKATVSHAAQSVCDAATGGSWGLARNVRIEHSALRVDSCAVHRGAGVGALQAYRIMTAPSSSSEAEVVHSANKCFIARLRRYRMCNLAKFHDSSFSGMPSELACCFLCVV
jgi:hypothetical protein